MTKNSAKEIDLFYIDFVISDMKNRNKKFYYNSKYDILSSEAQTVEISDDLQGGLEEITYEEARAIFSNPKKIFFAPPKFQFVSILPKVFFAQYDNSYSKKYGRQDFGSGQRNQFLYFQDDEHSRLLKILCGIKFKYNRVEKGDFISYNFSSTSFSNGLFREPKTISAIENNKNSLIVQAILEPEGLKNIISQIRKNMYTMGNFHEFLDFTFKKQIIEDKNKAEIFGAFLDVSTLFCSKKQNCEMLLNYCLENHRDDIETIKSEMTKRGLIDLKAKTQLFKEKEANVALINFSFLEIVKRYPVKLSAQENKNYYDAFLQLVISGINRVVKKNPDFCIEHINLYQTKDTGHNLLVVKSENFKDEIHRPKIEEIFLDSFKYINDFFNNQVELFKAQNKNIENIRLHQIKYTSFQGKEDMTAEKIDSILKTVIEKHAIAFAINNCGKNSNNDLSSIGADFQDGARKNNKSKI